MASYGNTVLTSAGIDLVKRVIAKTATFEITRVATSSDSRLTNATISTIEALTTMSSVQQTGKVTAFDTSNSKQVGLKCEFTNQGLTNQYNICGVGIYAKEAGKSEILFAVAPAKEPETMPAKPNDQSALFAFSLNMYVVVGQASAMSITATTEGVVKSINSTIKPDANGNVTMSYYSQAEVDQKISSLSSMIDSLNGSKTSNTDFNALKNRVAANESGKADKTSVYDKETADGRYLQRDASTTLKSGSVLRWDDSGHANDGNNVPYTAGGLRWSGKTDNVEVRAEETAQDNLDLVFNLGDDGSNNVDFRWNNVSKAKINSSGKFTGHVDWANVDGKDTYSRAEIDTKLSAKADTTSVKATADSLNTSITNAQDDIGTLQHRADSITNTLSKGGVNLLPGTRDFSWPQSWWASSGSQNQSNQYNSSEKVTEHKIVMTPDRDQGIWWDGYNTVGQTYTLSFDARCDNGKVKIWRMGLEGNLIVDAPLTTDWVRYHVTVKVTAGNYNWVTYFGTTGADTVYSRKYQIEYGEIATDWTPAPEDLEDSIDAALNTANAAKAKAEANANSIQALDASKVNKTDFNALKNRVAANESSKADKTSVYDKKTADDRYLQRDASTTLKSGSVLIWDDSGHANDGNNVPYTAGGLRWSGKTDNVEVRAEETAQDNLDLVFNLGDDGSNNVDFRWNNVSKAKINSSGKFTGHVDWANVDGKDTYSRAEIDTKLSAKADTTSVKATADSLNTSITNAQDDIGNLQQAADKLQSDLTNTKGAISSLDAKMPQAAYVPTVLTNDTDLNSMKTCGFYLLQGGTSNSPVDGWTYVTVQGISTRLTQFVWKDLDPAQQWCRLYDGNNWTPWTHYTKAL